MLLAAITRFCLPPARRWSRKTATLQCGGAVAAARVPAVDEKTSAEHRRMIALFDGEYKYPRPKPSE